MKDYGLQESWNEVLSIVDPDIVIASPKYRFADGEVLIWCEHFQGHENLSEQIHFYRELDLSKITYNLVFAYL